MPEQLLNVLKICLLVVLYLFFFRVMRAVWAEVRAPAPAVAIAAPAGQPRTRSPRRAPARGRHPRLLVVEPADLAGATFDLGAEVTIGRAAACGIALDDSFLSQRHARVFRSDGELMVEDLGSTNGTYLNRGRVDGVMVMQRGDQLQVGNTIMELR